MNIPIEEDKEEFGVKEVESLKLSKNTKGYNWDIKILEINIDRLDEINKKMVEKFGNANL